jgi:hypothetical protein
VWAYRAKNLAPPDFSSLLWSYYSVVYTGHIESPSALGDETGSGPLRDEPEEDRPNPKLSMPENIGALHPHDTGSNFVLSACFGKPLSA